MRKVFNQLQRRIAGGKIKRNKKRLKAFTLVEIMMVLVLLGLVMTIVGPRLTGALFGGQRRAVKIQIKQLEGYLDRYRLDCNFYPTTDQGLKALIEKPSGGKPCPNYDPNGYLPGGTNKKVPTDPWGTEFIYTCEDGINYVIKSLGKDGVEGGEGENADISSTDEN